MEIEIGRGKKGRRAYGFDDIAIVPSRRTRDPDDIDISWTLGPYRFELPLLASAMDGVVSPQTAGILGQPRRPRRPQPRGHLDPLRGRRRRQLARIASYPKDIATREMQEIYKEPVKDHLVAQRIREIKEQGVVCAASLTPQRVAQVLRGRRSRPASTSWSSRARSSRPSTCRRPPSRSTSRSSSARCRSRSWSAAAPRTRRAST